MTNYTKIITHGGQFHADEVLAIAAIFFLIEEMPVERKFQITDEEMNDPSILVLDVARQYAPELGNFDHHQSAGLPATNMLVLGDFCKDSDLAARLTKSLFHYVSKVDTGVIIEDGSVPTFNTTIRAMNGLDGGFEMALDYAKATFAAHFDSASKGDEGARRWANEVHKSGMVAIADNSEVIIGWKELAEADGVQFLVSPNLRGGWQVLSRDSAVFPIPAHESQTFRHNAAFLAVYPSKAEALKHARSI